VKLGEFRSFLSNLVEVRPGYSRLRLVMPP